MTSNIPHPFVKLSDAENVHLNWTDRGGALFTGVLFFS